MKKRKLRANTDISHKTIVREIDYDLLADAIINAFKRLEEQQQNLKKKRDKEEKALWKSNLGFKEIKNSWKPLRKWLCSVRNAIVGVWHLLWMRREAAYSDKATVALLSTITSKLIGFFKLLLYGLCVYTAIKAFYTDVWMKTVCLALMALTLFMIARVLRIVQFEIEKITDSQYLTNLLSTLLAVVALLVSAFAWIYPG